MIQDFGWFFLAGGVFSRLLAVLLFFGVLASAAGLLTGLLVRQLAGWIALGLVVLGGLSLSLGAFGYRHGIQELEAALGSVNPMDVATIRLAGTGEARTLIVLALLAAVLPFGSAVALTGAIPRPGATEGQGKRLLASFIAGASLAFTLSAAALSQTFVCEGMHVATLVTESDGKELLARASASSRSVLLEGALPGALTFLFAAGWFVTLASPRS